MLITDFTQDELRTIWEYWHTSKFVDKRYDRLQYACKHLVIKYPDISKMSFYKYLTRELS